MINIRDAAPEDGPAVAALINALDYPDCEGFIVDKINQARSHPDACLLVAVQDETVVGLISLHFIPQIALSGDFCRISYFCVQAAARGQGIGALLEERAVQLARQRGCDRIEVHCHARRSAAHRFYDRQGYNESPKYFIKPLSQ
ncbi:MAG: GNAT family N-acetyltransferase [Anaerolineae bacterium]|nr:GNAT family N-acetyltransferase [Anaerolineae bacterium]